jgi:hypothetical protein
LGEVATSYTFGRLWKSRRNSDPARPTDPPANV